MLEVHPQPAGGTWLRLQGGITAQEPCPYRCLLASCCSAELSGCPPLALPPPHPNSPGSHQRQLPGVASA